LFVRTPRGNESAAERLLRDCVLRSVCQVANIEVCIWNQDSFSLGRINSGRFHIHLRDLSAREGGRRAAF
jgi:hypothetical protein